MDRGFFTSIMGACALAAARARDGAAGDRFEYDDSPENSSETFFVAARDACMMDLNNSRNLGFLRGHALLALTAVQYGQIETMHIFLGHYFTMAATQKFHDEDEWPNDLTLVEKEERRRLFWTMYQFDIYTSVVFDSAMHAQEIQSNVRYPSELEDEQIPDESASPPVQGGWLRGWNFITDLSRVLEHTVNHVRRQGRLRGDRISIVRLIVAEGAPNAQVMESVLNLYYQLPDRFKEYTAQMTGNRGQDMYGFQAAGIQASLQLVRMTLLSAASESEVDQRCAVADQVLTVFRSISPPFLQAISTPLVYHLGSIGQILGKVMEGPLREDTYIRVRTLMVSLAELLAELESGLQPTAGASKDLHNKIRLIDEYMNAQRRLIPAGQMPPAGIAASRPDTASTLYAQPQTSNGIRIHPTLDEFQLPQDLVHDGTWPWPFGMTQDPQQAPSMMYAPWPDNKPA